MNTTFSQLIKWTETNIRTSVYYGCFNLVPLPLLTNLVSALRSVTQHISGDFKDTDVGTKGSDKF